MVTLLLTCLAPIDSNIFSNSTLICWMLFISTQGWRETLESEKPKKPDKEKQNRGQDIGFDEEDERMRGRQQEVDVEQWAAVADRIFIRSTEAFKAL